MLTQITPIVPVADLKKSIAFFCEVLGFTVRSETEDYAQVQRDKIAISLVTAPPGTDMHDPKRQLSCYITVDGIDDLYEELKPDLETLPEGRVKAPFNQTYGQREFHVIDEDALLIFFGEKIDLAKQ